MGAILDNIVSADADDASPSVAFDRRGSLRSPRWWVVGWVERACSRVWSTWRIRLESWFG